VFTGWALMAWAAARGVRHLLNDAGCSTQNACIESFDGKFRDDSSNEEWFETLAQARQEVARWRCNYNEVRPFIGARPASQLHQPAPKIESPPQPGTRRLNIATSERAGHFTSLTASSLHSRPKFRLVPWTTTSFIHTLTRCL